MALKFNQGSVALAVAYRPTTQAPLDVRTVVDSYSDIKDTLNVFKNGQDDTSYIGMVVVAADTAKAYVLASKTPVTWKELGADIDLSEFAGAFKFKGVAYEVSPDNTYIVLNGDDAGTIKSIGTACDLEGNTYFGWLVNDEEVWTTNTWCNNAIQYTKSDTGTTVYGITINEEHYFLSETQPESGTLLSSIDGDYIIVEEGTGSLEGLFSDTNPIGVYKSNEKGEYSTDTLVYGYAFKYTGYEFTEGAKALTSFYTLPLLASDGTKKDGEGNTIPSNIGHVYQIGENEYASNGQIWVKLGAPTEDWIVL